jgi:hypothetical protein
LLGGVLYATWQAAAGTDDPEPDPIGLDEPEPDFSLTDEEAIARFKELETLQVSAYEHVDLTLVNDFAGPGPFKEKVLQELRQLKQDDVFALLSMKNQELEVTQNTRQEIKLEETVTLNIEFREAEGGDVTSQGRPQRLLVEWTLESFSNGWLLTESTAIDVIDSS